MAFKLVQESFLNSSFNASSNEHLSSLPDVYDISCVAYPFIKVFVPNYYFISTLSRASAVELQSSRILGWMMFVLGFSLRGFAILM